MNIQFQSKLTIGTTLQKVLYCLWLGHEYKGITQLQSHSNYFKPLANYTGANFIPEHPRFFIMLPQQHTSESRKHKKGSNDMASICQRWN